MGLFGPTQQEMQDAVANGIHQAIRETKHRSYKIKQGKVMVLNDYVYIPEPIRVELHDSFDKHKIHPSPRKVKVTDKHYIIYDVIYYEEMTRFNPFTDIKTTDVIKELNIGRYYSYDGWNMDKINRLIRWAKMHGYYPTEKWMIAEALTDGK